MRFFRILALGTALVGALVSCSKSDSGSISDMRCEYAVEPMTVDTQTPRFSWTYEGDTDFYQHSYELSVYDQDGKEIWNSGEVISSVSFAKMGCNGHFSKCGSHSEGKHSADCGKHSEGGHSADCGKHSEGAHAANCGKHSEGKHSADCGKHSEGGHSANCGKHSEGRHSADCGSLFASDSEYSWKVRAWDAAGKCIESAAAPFRTAIFCESEWKAEWISDSFGKDYEAAPMFRKEFDAKSGIKSARVYMSACAYGLIGLNGKPISDAYLDPGYTHYDKRNLYTITDVTSQLREGRNVITAVLGNGFYNAIKPVATWGFEGASWRNRARFILEMHIDYADGSREVVATDSSWKTTADGPYIHNNIYSGDLYDARKEIKGWDSTGFDDSAYASAQVVPAPSAKLVAQKMQQIRPSEVLKPVKVQAFGDSVYVFDFGKNIAGLCTLSVEGEEGTVVSLAHTELLKEDGSIEPGNINIYYIPQPGYDFQTDRYILKGEGREVWTPAFNYHGFRYVELKTSKPLKIDANSLCANVFHTAVESIGEFACSNPLLEQVWEMTRRSYLGNLMSIPTDCPQREKNGWTADAYLSQEIGLLNYDTILFYEKWLDDFIDNQRPNGAISGIIPTWGWGYEDWIGPVWDAALFILPYNLYLYTGDDSIIKKLWPVCQDYLAYLKSREEADGLVSYGIGDWLPYDKVTPTEYTSALFYCLDWRIMKEFSFIMDANSSIPIDNEDRLRNAINRKFYDPSTGLYAGGTQAGQAAALYAGIVPASELSKVVAGLERMVDEADGHLNFGSMGSKLVLRMLTKHGLADKAFAMASKEDEPSWINWIKKGYTTLGETWVMSPEFNDASLNHIFFGDISAWMVNDIVGIRYDVDYPGFQHIVIAPHFVEGLNNASASYKSVRGEIRASWTKRGSKVVVELSIPCNTTATLMPNGSTERINVSAGSHTFTFDL